MQPFPISVNFFQNLRSIQTNPWFLAEGEHFPQSDSEHPGVRGMAKLSGLETLRGTPWKRHLFSLGHNIAIILLKCQYLLGWLYVKGGGVNISNKFLKNSRILNSYNKTIYSVPKIHQLQLFQSGQVSSKENIPTFYLVLLTYLSLNKEHKFEHSKNIMKFSHKEKRYFCKKKTLTN